MDPVEASSIVFDRIRKYEPKNVANIIFGHLLLHDHGGELFRLAFGPDNLILNIIKDVKTQLGLVPNPPISPSININPISDHPIRPLSPFSSPQTISMPNPYWKPQLMVDTKFNPEVFGLQSPQFLGLEDQLEHVNSGFSPFSSDYYFSERPFPRGPRSPSEFPIKTCHYFNKGFCKHGNKCRFIHDGFSNIEEFGVDEQSLSPGSLEKLELEIMELLKMRRGSPVSIASLPMLYYEKYGRTLQAEGYLTESQRHGKAGYSLTKLLARLRNSIHLIDRPHGQHAVILAEDAQNYFESLGDRNDPGPIVNGSRQVYMTFPAESSFLEEDVADYFSLYGTVQDVRLPGQQRRMFGFVTFASSDTVKMILTKGNPHYICGARVLVKPYREKSKIIERKYPDKFDPTMLYGSHYADFDIELQSRWESRRFMRELFIADQEQNLETQFRRFSEMQLAPNSLPNKSYIGSSLDELRVQLDNSKFASAECYNHLLDVLKNDSQGDYFVNQIEANNIDPERVEVAPPAVNNVSPAL